MKVIFEKDDLEDKWFRKEFYMKHNHEKDNSIIPDVIINYLDNYLSLNLYKTTGMEII